MADLITREEVVENASHLSVISRPDSLTAELLRLNSTVESLYEENAELRRWLGAAAWFMALENDAKTFRALSRGEPVSEDVRRLYLGDEE